MNAVLSDTGNTADMVSAGSTLPEPILPNMDAHDSTQVEKIEWEAPKDDLGVIAGNKFVPSATIVRADGSTVQVFSPGPKPGLWPGDSVTVHHPDGMILVDTQTGVRIFARQGEAYLCKARDTATDESTWRDTACKIAGLLLIGVAFVVGAIWAVGDGV